MKMKRNKKKKKKNKTPTGFIRTAVPLPCQKAAQVILEVSRAADSEGTMSYRKQERNSVHPYIRTSIQIFESVSRF